jgi:hypothetical protein
LICVKVARSDPSIFIIVIAEQSKEGCYDFDRAPAIISLGLLILAGSIGGVFP